jgi:hypothetical protein
MEAAVAASDEVKKYIIQLEQNVFNLKENCGSGTSEQPSVTGIRL